MGDNQIFKGAGCKRCNMKGYRGRLGLFEMMMLNAEIRELAFNRAPTNKIRSAALANGMVSLLEDGKRKIFLGTTTMEEVSRFAQAEEEN